ncbi:MAG: T9SS type A sorting domain-containing protein [candidate division KSB1 bacterium]|nr:T9SS type A sorting domain-containing protein [candidate division KSB1 bacterium]MDZ7342724.1 T9SS type A sorting domain-containing protein [candidate division KSB1 bacterium]
MKRSICIVLGGLCLILSRMGLLYGQITVTAKDAPSIPGTHFVMSYQDTVDVNLGEPGADRSWDFSALSLPKKSYWRVVDYATSPFAYRFNKVNANLVYEVTYDDNDTITYNYARITDTDLTELGRGKLTVVGNNTVFTEITIGKRATPKLNLPATYGVPEWSSVLEIDTTYSIFKVTIKDSSYNKIDAWGKIKTQFGEYACLRIRQNHSRFVYLGSGAIPLEINVNYFWVTNNYGILATVTGFSDITNPNPNPNYARAKSVDIMTSFTPAAVPSVSSAQPLEFDLWQNYPNPFNPKTLIRYRLNASAQVSLKVFNVEGQQVAVLVQAQQPAGQYEAPWNAWNLPAGIYYYRLQANNQQITKKCLLLK